MNAVQQLDPALPPATVFAQLDREVQRLVVATKTLYNGDWDDCAEDIRRRRAGKPYLFKLSISLPDDLEWLSRLKAYESARGEAFEASQPDDHPREDHR